MPFADANARFVSRVRNIDFGSLRTSDEIFFDQLLRNQLAIALSGARDHFERTNFRQGIEVGFVNVLINWKQYCLQGDAESRSFSCSMTDPPLQCARWASGCTWP